uniref:S41 family peptidase n=1 Tax=Flavobacterium sp. TaxID=239 RepID=UPI00404A333C
MNIKTVRALLFFLIINVSYGQEYGNFPTIEKDKLIRDLDILQQSLDKFHSGMYWYTSKDSVDVAFNKAKLKLTRDKNVLEFHKLIAPLVALSREDHTNIYLPNEIIKIRNQEGVFFPLTIVFLGTKLYGVRNGSADESLTIEGYEIETINNEKPIDIVTKIGTLFASDGYITSVKYHDLVHFNFSKYYFYYYGNVKEFKVKFKDVEEEITIQGEKIGAIEKNLISRYPSLQNTVKKDLLEFKLLDDSTAYLGVHSFSNPLIKEGSKEKNIKQFFKNSFKEIAAKNIKNLIIDVSENGGGNEGNENLLYSYLGMNYQKYIKVRAKTQKIILDNGMDPPIKLKTFGFLERIFLNKKVKDNSLERKEWIGFGLMAYKKEPKNKFKGKSYVIIGPETYSGGSEFSNMMYSNDIATFVGQETGGGYFGNTSGYSNSLILPHSKIEIEIPALQFEMNVNPKLPFGSGVIPDHIVIPTFKEYLNKENVSLKFILNQIKENK